MSALRYVIGWKIRHLRCTLFGCKWGRERSGYEGEYLYERWVECERCGAFEHTYHAYEGQTEFGRRLEAASR